jgi:hypothetical protein
MKFFTRELWLGAQSASQANHDRWQDAFDAYRAQLSVLRPRLSQAAFQFFLEADVHDGELLKLLITDASRPAPLDEPPRPWTTPRSYPVRVDLSVLDALDKLVWRLAYKTVRRILVDYPTEQPLFYREGNGFGNWGYHELTDAGSGFLRHEVLFGTGAVLLFEFAEVEITSVPRSSPDSCGEQSLL